MSSFKPVTFDSKTEDFWVKTESADGKNIDNKTNLTFSESLLSFCQTCLTNKKNSKLKNMMQRHYHNGKYELYSEMMDYCFSLQPRRSYHNNVYMICEPCISKLREVVDFRNQVEDAQINIKLNIKLPSLSFASHRDVGENVEDEFELIDSEISLLLNDNDCTDPYTTVNKETQFITDSILNDENEDSFGSTAILKQYDDNLVDEKFEKYVTPKENPIPAVLSYDSLPYKLKCRHPTAVKNKSNPNKTKNINISLQENMKNSMKLTKRVANKQYARNDCLPYKLDPNQLKCKICIVEFESHQELQKHMPSHFPNFTCETCGRVFANRKQITSHKRLQHQNEIIECPLCPEKRFKNRAYKSVHMKRFHGNDKKDFRCSYCDESFIRSEQRERHLILVHELAEMRYKCESCDATFSSNARRSDHFRRVHLNERKFVCEVCSYSCFVRGGLEKHMLKHTGVRNFSCSVCQKKFLRKCTLDLHTPIHTGEKKHVCEICGKAFIQKCALNAHMQVHERRRLKGKGKI